MARLIGTLSSSPGAGTPGVPTGGGGAGAANETSYAGGAGGSGVVRIRYTRAQVD